MAFIVVKEAGYHRTVDEVMKDKPRSGATHLDLNTGYLVRYVPDATSQAPEAKPEEKKKSKKRLAS